MDDRPAQRDPEGVPCYWINRSQDHVRRSEMAKWLDASDIPHTRIEALTPDTLPQVKLLSHHRGLTTSLELACIASHLRAVQSAYRDGHPHALIMEDDVRSPYMFDFKKIIDQAPKDWDVLQLHTHNAPIVVYLADMFRKFGVLWQEWVNHNHSAGAYLINRRGMKKLITAHLREEGQHRLIDLTMIYTPQRVTSEFVLFRRPIAYTATIPFFLSDTAMGSTIHPEHLPDHQKGRETAFQIMSALQREFEKNNPNGLYPFAVRPIESLFGEMGEPPAR